MNLSERQKKVVIARSEATWQSRICGVRFPRSRWSLACLPQAGNDGVKGFNALVLVKGVSSYAFINGRQRRPRHQ